MSRRSSAWAEFAFTFDQRLDELAVAGCGGEGARFKRAWLRSQDHHDRFERMTHDFDRTGSLKALMQRHLLLQSRPCIYSSASCPMLGARRLRGDCRSFWHVVIFGKNQVKKFSNLIGACLSAALFAACGGSGLSSLQFPSNPMLRAPKDLGARKCAPHCIYVAQPRLGRQSPDEILFFSRLADGNTPPVASIAGSKTAMGYVEGVAMDSRGDLYVTNGASNTITVYASGSQGNVAPIRTIGGPKTQLNLPQSLALDGATTSTLQTSASSVVPARA